MNFKTKDYLVLKSVAQIFEYIIVFKVLTYGVKKFNILSRLKYTLNHFKGILHTDLIRDFGLQA
jgi:ribonuclease HIII